MIIIFKKWLISSGQMYQKNFYNKKGNKINNNNNLK